MTSAEALLRINPRLGEDYLAELVTKLDARIARVTGQLADDPDATPEIVAGVLEFHLDRPFYDARQSSGMEGWRWNRDWAALVERIGTPAMRAWLARARDALPTGSGFDVEAERARPLALPPATPTPAPAPMRTQRALRDLVAAGRLGATPAEQAIAARVLLPVDTDGDAPVDPIRSPERRRTIGEMAELKRARRAVASRMIHAAGRAGHMPTVASPPGGVLPETRWDDPLDDDLPPGMVDPGATPADRAAPRLVEAAMRPVYAGIERVKRELACQRRAVTATEKACRAWERTWRQPIDDRNDLSVAHAAAIARRDLLASTLDAQRARVDQVYADLLPQVRAIVAGEAPPWRVKGDRIIDQSGRDWRPAALARSDEDTADD